MKNQLFKDLYIIFFSVCSIDILIDSKKFMKDVVSLKLRVTTQFTSEKLNKKKIGYFRFNFFIFCKRGSK